MGTSAQPSLLPADPMLGSSLYFPPPASRSYDGAWGGVPPDLSLTCPAVLAHPQGTGLPWSHRTPSDSLRMGRGGVALSQAWLCGLAGWEVDSPCRRGGLCALLPLAVPVLAPPTHLSSGRAPTRAGGGLCCSRKGRPRVGRRAE